MGKPPLGEGGQGSVFRVVDVKGEYDGEYALKRVLNPARRPRFRQEIEAIRRLDHPNVIKLIDHSALDVDSDQTKQFLVMPVAEAGDLSRAARLSLYRDSIEGVIQVGKQITSALSAAHEAGIVHRDIKPQNVLCTGDGHEVWVSDFGICLLREQERVTPEGEIVGPWAFMAPELAYGGQLEVSAAADSIPWVSSFIT